MYFCSVNIVNVAGRCVFVVVFVKFNTDLDVPSGFWHMQPVAVPPMAQAYTRVLSFGPNAGLDSL